MSDWNRALSRKDFPRINVVVDDRLPPDTMAIGPYNPAENELDRAEYLLGRLSRSVTVARSNNMERASVDVEEADELCQLLADSLKTAKQMQGR